MNETPSYPRPTPPELPSTLNSLDPSAGGGSVIESLLKRPMQLIDALQREHAARHTAWLLTFAIVAFAAYGLLVGSFSGGAQFGFAAAKVSVGALATVLICLPSFFIFSCLAGADITLRSTVGVLAAVLATIALLLIGFAPIAWIFSESTTSASFIGFLHLSFWLIALGFGLRLPRILMNSLGVRERLHLRVWTVILVLVSLQMTTALRPILGKSDRLLPGEKKFFIAHWIENLVVDAENERKKE